MIKRKALLLGYSGYDEKDNYLSAVENDLKSYKKFLMSPKGGLWENDEIKTMIDEKLESIDTELLSMKNKYDFVYIIYSGHGCYTKCQNLGINQYDYHLADKDFEKLAPRQITVIDACAGKLSGNESINESVEKLIEKNTLDPKERTRIREKYESQIQQSPQQEITLYSAEPGELSGADSKESYYIGELLSELNSVEEDISIIKVHEIAKKEVIKRSQGTQHPYSKVVPYNVSEYLPGAIDDLF